MARGDVVPDVQTVLPQNGQFEQTRGGTFAHHLVHGSILHDDRRVPLCGEGSNSRRRLPIVSKPQQSRDPRATGKQIGHDRDLARTAVDSQRPLDVEHRKPRNRRERVLQRRDLVHDRHRLGDAPDLRRTGGKERS